MTPVCAVAVVVPAHDEQDRVLDCLDAVSVARARLRRFVPHVRTVVVVALDACRDATGRLVAGRPDVLTVEVERRRVGAARAAGTAYALARLNTRPELTWTAHTDADSCVPPDWLVAMTAAAGAGIDAVLGTVVPDPSLAEPVRARWSALHPVHDGHPHVHGANLGVRASTLAAVGGWRPLVTGEDVDLAGRLRDHPAARVWSTGGIPVVTSARPDARAPAGFAGYLRDLTVA